VSGALIMGIVDPAAIPGLLAGGDIPSVVLLHGSDDSRKRQVLSAICQKLNVDPMETGNYEIGDASLSSVLSQCMSLPFLSDRRCIILHGIQVLKAAEVDDLIKALPAIPVSTCFIMVTRNTGEVSAGSPKKLLEAVKPIGMAVEFTLLKGAEMKNWLRAQSSAQGKTFQLAALELFTEFTKADPNLASMELSKLIDYVGERKELTERDVRDAMSRTAEAQVFEVVNAVASGKAREAVHYIRGMFDSGLRGDEVIVQVLAQLIRHYRLIWQMKVKMSGGDPRECFPSDLNLDDELKSKPFIAKRLEAHARRMPSFKSITQCFELMYMIDANMKGIETNGESLPKEALEKLVIDLCRS